MQHGSDIHEVLATTCASGQCPTIYLDPENCEGVIVQGDVSDIETPEGEQAVRVPLSLLRAAIESVHR